MTQHADASPLVDALQRKIEALEQELAEQRRDARRFRALLAAGSLSVSVSGPDGRHTHLNPGWERLWGVPAAKMLQLDYSLFTDEQLAELGIRAYIERLYQGEELTVPPLGYDATRNRGWEQWVPTRWVHTCGMPVRGDGGSVDEIILIQLDLPEAAEIARKHTELLEEQRQLQASLRERNLELEETLRVVEEQRDAIQALSVPVLRIWDGVLCLPIVGMIDDARAGQLLERLLEAIAAQGASEVILDITGVPALDDRAAAHLLRAASAARLLGAECAVVGVSPAIAQTLVELGVDLGALTTAATLADGLSRALSRRAPGVCARIGRPNR